MSDLLEPRLLLAAQLVKDINTSPAPGLFLGNVASVGNIAYFMESDGAHGAELWKTDGTTAGTQLVKDINPGGAGSYPSGFTTINGITYFSAADDADGTELWRTDGTTAGTWRVKDINPGAANSSPSDLTADGSVLYFFADDGTHGRKLWRSDGTDAGTSFVADIGPSADSQTTSPYHRMIATTDGTLYFYGYSASKLGLYKSDGTPGNFTALAPSIIGINSSVVACGNRVYFEDGLGYIWTSDGTTTGTTALDTTNSLATALHNVNGSLFYIRGSSLKTISGTTVSTVAGSYRNPGFVLNVNGTVYFPATSTATGHPGLWKCPAGTTSAGLVVDNLTIIGAANASGTPYFLAGTSTSGYSVYRSDGTASGTTAIALVNAGGSLSAPVPAGAAGSSFLFVNSDPVSGSELWASDGTAAGTGLLRDIYPGTNASQPLLWPTTPLNGKILLTANDGVHGFELWASDGTAAGTILLDDIAPGPANAGPQNLRVAGNRAYFQSGNATLGQALWTTDGTPAGTYEVASIYPGGIPNPAGFTLLNGWVYFSATDGVHGTELWRTNGDPGSAQMVADINPGSADSSPYDFTVLNDSLYFIATTAANGTELWRTDGTAAGTQIVKDLTPGPGGSVSGLTAVNGTLYFDSTSNVTNSDEPWESDGTAAGTFLIKDLNPGSTSGAGATGFVPYDGRIYFAARGPGVGYQIWSTDGTAAGTSQVTSLPASNTPISNLTPLSGRLYFMTTGLLWSTAGGVTTKVQTAAGVPLDVLSITPVDGHMAMDAIGDNSTGQELWITDGTPAGTRLVQDLFPGEWPGVGGIMIWMNGFLYTSGSDGVFLGELFRFPDTFAPFVWNSQFVAAPSGSESVSFNFNEPVTGLSASKISIIDLATNSVEAVGPVTMSYDSAAGIATFSFAALPAGSYRAVLSSAGVTDSAGNPLPADVPVDFAISTLTGAVFDDVNHNGTRDSGEAVLAGRTVFVDANNNGSLDPGEVSVTTDASGSYVFPDVPAGAVTVREVLPAGWARTAPLGSALSVSVIAGQPSAGPTFGDVQISTVPMSFNYLLTLAQHYGQQGTFATGDLNGDDTVNFADLLLLAQNYGHALPAAAAPASGDGLLSVAARRKLRLRI